MVATLIDSATSLIRPLWVTELPGGVIEIGLPHSVRTRPAAVMLMAAVCQKLTGRTVLLNARETTGSEIYAAELLELLHHRQVAAVLLTPTDALFEGYLRNWAQRLGVTLTLSAVVEHDASQVDPPVKLADGQVQHYTL